MSARERIRSAGGVARWIVAFAFATGLVGLVLASLPGGTARAPRSALSREATGRLFAFRLLQALDFPVRIWSETPGALPRGRALVWLAETPPEPPEYLTRIWEREQEDAAGPAPTESTSAEDEGERVVPTRSSGRARDPRHYRRFVEEGGVLLAGIADGRREFLEDVLGIGAVRELDLVLAPEGVGTERRTTVASLGGEPFEIRPAYRVPWRDFGTSSDGADAIEWLADPSRVARPLIADPDDPSRAVAWRIPLGRGELVVLTQDELFANHAIEDADGGNGLYLVRLFEAIGPVDEILFDEYALGARVHPTAVELALAPGRAPITLHLVLACALWLWGLAVVRAFPRERQEAAGASPAARAEAFGATLARLGRFDELGEMLRRGVLARLPGARRGAAATGADELPAGASERTADADVEAALAAVAHVARDEDELARWREALRAEPVRSAAGLAELARELSPLERAASQRLRRPIARLSPTALANRASETHNPGAPADARKPRR